MNLISKHLLAIVAAVTTSAAAGSDPSLARNDIRFYEGNHCSQAMDFSYDSRFDYNENCKVAGRCKGDNDEARSVLILPGIQRRIKITVYDDPKGRHNADYTVIDVERPEDIPPGGICVWSLGRSWDYGAVKQHGFGSSRPSLFYNQYGLDGKVSHVRIQRLP